MFNIKSCKLCSKRLRKHAVVLCSYFKHLAVLFIQCHILLLCCWYFLDVIFPSRSAISTHYSHIHKLGIYCQVFINCCTMTMHCCCSVHILISICTYIIVITVLDLWCEWNFVLVIALGSVTIGFCDYDLRPCVNTTTQLCPTVHSTAAV